MAPARFRPRRLGHVNLWVSDLERSVRFYEQACGIELVRREPAIRIAFHSNGNTHHDIGLVETSKGVDRIGRDGRVQIPATRGIRVGLNHFGWEMPCEAELVEAYVRAGESKLRAVDHLISRSVYVGDPDGNGHEFYADSLRDWRSIYNLGREDEVTGEWTPGTPVPSREGFYNVDPPLRRIDAAPIHPRRLAGASIMTPRFDALTDFLVDTAGLAAQEGGEAGRRRSVFAGSLGYADMEVIERDDGNTVGLHSFTFSACPDVDFDALCQASVACGGSAPERIRDSTDELIELRDPDGFIVRFRIED